MPKLCAEDAPMVSVAMIAYNKEAVIGRAIEGVMRQKASFRVELVVVDDKSTDRTATVVQEYCQKYPNRIRFYQNEANKGLQANYLEAFSHCTGRYMAICDADDYWLSRHKLRRQVEYMKAHPECSVSFHRVINLYEADGSMSLSNGRQRVDTTIEDLARSNYITNLSVVYRRERVDLSRLPRWILEDRSPDYAMHMLYAATGSIHYFKRPMGVYRISAGGAWSLTESAKRLEMALEVRRHLLAHFAERPEVCRGLQQSVEAIERALRAPSAPKRPPLAKRLRAALTRLLPAPR